LDDSCAEQNETARYAPYVKASNRALDGMHKHHEKFERKFKLRPPSSLNLRFHRNDPRVLQTQYPGTKEPVKQKPDVITTQKQRQAIVEQQMTAKRFSAKFKKAERSQKRQLKRILNGSPVCNCVTVSRELIH
jgi:hypothetical protein